MLYTEILRMYNSRSSTKISLAGRKKLEIICANDGAGCGHNDVSLILDKYQILSPINTIDSTDNDNTGHTMSEL